MKEESIEDKIKKIKQMFEHLYCDRVEVVIKSNYIPEEKYVADLIYVEPYGITHDLCFICKNDTNKINGFASCDISETGNSINSTINNLYNLCVQYLKANYDISAY